VSLSSLSPGLRVVVAIAALSLLGIGSSGAVAGQPRYEREVESYAMPDVTLVNQRGQPVRLLDLVDSGKPILVNFIYTTCATIGPVLAAGFSNLQQKLGPRAQGVQLISFTMDPEYDSPARMARFLKRYRARPGWDFLTGTRSDIDRVMLAFDAYVDKKMSHEPLTFLKAPGSGQWVRALGLLSTSELLAEFEKIGGAP